MTEHLLNDTKVGTVIEQVGRTGVPEDMGRQMLANPGALSILLDDEPGTLAAQPTATLVEEQRFGIVSELPSHRNHPCSAVGREPLVEGTRRRTTVGDDPLFRSLAEQSHELRVVVGVADRKPDDLGDSRPVAYSSSRSARSRTWIGSLPITASSRLVICASLSGFGIPDGTRTPSIGAAGSSGRICSIAMYRCSILIAAICRAIVELAAPLAFRWPTSSVMSPLSADMRSSPRAVNQPQYASRSRR